MGCWHANGDGICQGCGKVRPGIADRDMTITYLRAAGWHYSAGYTQNLAPYEMLLCPQCARDEKKRVVNRQPVLDQDALPLDWDACRPEVKGEGAQSR
jgi:hypothetical protein